MPKEENNGELAWCSMGLKTIRTNRTWWYIGLALVLLLAAGCSMTKVSKSFPLFEKPGAGATVVWMRPETERPMGIADSPVSIELNGELLMKLGKGESKKVNIVPRDYTVTLRNQSEAGSYWWVKDMKRRSKWKFEPGQTYYLAVKAVDGEFRGVTFKIERMSEFDAKAMAANLRER